MVGVWAGTGRIYLIDVRRTWLSFKTQGRKQLGIYIRSEEDRSRPMGMAPGSIMIHVHHYYFYNILHEYVSHLSKHALHLRFHLFLGHFKRKAAGISWMLIMCQVLYVCVCVCVCVRMCMCVYCIIYIYYI